VYLCGVSGAKRWSRTYLSRTSPFSPWKSRSESSMMSPWLILGISALPELRDANTHQTFFRSLPRMWARRFCPSKHCASSRPLPGESVLRQHVESISIPSILRTWAYSATVRCYAGRPHRDTHLGRLP
jgi:hypothetical protein